MTTELTKVLITKDEALLENVILHGDLAELPPAERVFYYKRVCESLGLNPFTRPFDFIKLNNKLTLYIRKDATDQLRSLRNVSIEITGREVIEGVYIVTAKGLMNAGMRTDESTGAVDIANLKGEFRANAMMKAETKAKRRVTLSIVGLGWLDESEVSDIPKQEAEKISIDMATGEITESKPETTKSTEAKIKKQPESTQPEAKTESPTKEATVATLKETMQLCNWGATAVGQYCVSKGWKIREYKDLTPDQLKELIEHLKQNPK